ncbi:hypothetical protein IPG41_02990 [Candidatus Peregrinibacteria bacterium]|nr:MAG: hypothetical protein IPG41_02990 [Candidatus Peregrinibacteria bacterium]
MPLTAARDNDPFGPRRTYVAPTGLVFQGRLHDGESAVVFHDTHVGLTDESRWAGPRRKKLANALCDFLNPQKSSALVGRVQHAFVDTRTMGEVAVSRASTTAYGLEALDLIVPVFELVPVSVDMNAPWVRFVPGEGAYKPFTIKSSSPEDILTAIGFRLSEHVNAAEARYRRDSLAAHLAHSALDDILGNHSRLVIGHVVDGGRSSKKM